MAQRFTNEFRIAISDAQANQFELTIDRLFQALRQDELNRLCLSSPLHAHRGLQISFDLNRRPFFGHSRGYNNENKPPRTYIPETNFVLNLVQRWLLDAGRGSGRVFLDSAIVVSHSEPIGEWSSPADSPLARVERSYLRAMSRLRRGAA